MADSFLSFGNSELFRKQLLVRNLQPYNVLGAYTSPGNPINFETNLTVSNVIDSPNNYVSSNLFASELYPLNEYGPDGGFGEPIGVNVTPISEPNQGPYYPLNGEQTQGLVLLNEFYIESAYVTNKFGPSGGYKDLIIITDVQIGNNIYQPYWYPNYFNFSSYSPFNIVFQDDPIGSNGPLSADSYLAKIGAAQLKFAFNERIAQEIEQATIGSINLDTITDPFSASLLATGQQPLFIRDWRITVPEGPVLATISLANRLTGTYFPVSFIPGDYFEETNPYTNPQQTNSGLNIVNNLTGGLLAPILNKTRNPSEIFVANTGNGTRSVLFATLNYNIYRPSYNIGFIQGISALAGTLVGQDTPATGTYYVGNSNVEPSLIDSPPNQVPVNQFGQQQATIVYGPQELAILYEGNEDQLNFGLKGKSYSDGGGTSGQLVWTSPKYKENAGFHATIGGGVGSSDGEFNEISADYLRYQSTDIAFKPGSILYQTQKLVESADQVQGQARLKHVGTAINQVSKVFNDGYKELTKGSKVLSYVNQSDGTQAGLEYCRIFQKDTPYYTYADLQKVDGITTSGRKFDYSIFDNTYNLNIAPLKNPGSTNIVDGKVKKYMFSLENLAWRTSDRPGFTYDDLPVCEKGPNGGRIMWFPPYNLKFSDDTKPDFNSTSFIGRPEPIYTYKNTSRTGSLSWTIVVDSPSMMNTIIEKQMKGASKERIQSVVDSFFAGCTKYDLYELGIKFNTIPTKDLYTYQQILNNPRLTSEEQIQVYESLPINQETTVEGDSSGSDNTQNSTSTGTQTQTNIQYDKTNVDTFVGYAFYFENDIPKGNPETVAASPYDIYYNQYIGLQPTYLQQAPQTVYVGTDPFSKDGIPNFFSSVIQGNFEFIQTDFLNKLNEVLVDKKGKVTMQLVGSASAPQKLSYNKKLSERRNDSVKKWFLAQKLKDGNTLEKYQSDGFFTMNFDSAGEQLVIPKTQEKPKSPDDNVDISVTTSQGGPVLNASVDCTKNITTVSTNNPTSGDVESSSKAQWYSIPAMACRRVSIKSVTIEVPITEQPQPSQAPPTPKPTPVPNILTGQTQSIKPEPKLTVEQKIKEGISKKILRNLFTECDYFQVIKESDPMIYDTIKEKIKFFSPTFHSMTPEGLNARLTFLQQCTRPGQTIPVIGTDGRPKYNDALNTTFGAPPILILRVGDFYHTKIVPTQLSISYDPLILDINPEGIGVQPMLANITLTFNIIGGMGLREPVQELQNALSFNYYANTEIYDERATPTEDTSKLDQYVVQQLTSGLPNLSSQQADNIANNIQPKKGGTTVGVVASATEMDYDSTLLSLQDGLQLYFKSYYECISKINNDYNYGLVQIALQDRSYTEGELSEYTNDKTKTILFGKSNVDLGYIDELVGDVKKDIEKNDDPILEFLKGVSQMTNKIKRELEDKLQNYANERKGPMSDIVTNNTSNLIKNQTNLNFIFRQLDVVNSKLDGELGSNNEPVTYDLSGDTFFGPATTEGTLANLYTNKVPEALSKFESLLVSNNVTSKDGFYNKKKSTIENGQDCKFQNKTGVGNQYPFGDSCAYNRFYIAMSPLFTKEDLYTKFIEDLTSGNEIKGNATVIEKLKERCLSLKNNYTEFQKGWSNIFENIEKSQEYDTLSKFKLPDTQIKKCNFVSPSTTNLNDKNKKLKDLYSSVNLNDNKKTFNGKVTFN